MSINVDEILKQAELINKQINQHNNEMRKQEGIREATKSQLMEELNAFNKEYGTDLNLEDTDALQKVYLDSVKEIYSNKQHLQQVLEAVGNGDTKLVSELTGLDIGQDIIQMPRININMDEMEKQADKAYKQVVNETQETNNLLGVSEPIAEVDATQEEEEEEEGLLSFGSTNLSIEDEEPSFKPSTPTVNPQQDVRAFFGNKLSPQSEAHKEENQTVENTTPNFSAAFNSKNNNTTSSEDSKPLDFSKMFNNVHVDTEEKKEETGSNINSFLSGFSNVANNKEKTGSTPNVEEALKKQNTAPPKMNFSSFSIDDEDE